MLRITTIPSGKGTQRLRVEGRLAGEFVTELSRATYGALAMARTVRLDLADVTFVDQTGVELLRSLHATGVDLIDCSPFVQSLITGGSR